MSEEEEARWFPFSAGELQMAFGIYGFVATAVAFTGVAPRALAWSSVGYVLLAYLAGLLVHAQRGTSRTKFVRDGGLGGVGYIEPFRRVRRCLYLMHVDDDPPSEELLLLYRRLLERGIQVRRLVFLRADAKPPAYQWIAEFGSHPNLQQRVLRADPASSLRFSFVVVDDAMVLVAVPGWEAIDDEPYATHLVLRHLLAVKGREIGAAFQSIHKDLWERAVEVEPTAFQDLPTLAECKLQSKTNIGGM